MPQAEPKAEQSNEPDSDIATIGAINQLLDACKKLNPQPAMTTPEQAAAWVKSFAQGGDVEEADLERACELLAGFTPFDGYDPESIMQVCRNFARHYE